MVTGKKALATSSRPKHEGPSMGPIGTALTDCRRDGGHDTDKGPCKGFQAELGTVCRHDDGHDTDKGSWKGFQAELGTS